MFRDKKAAYLVNYIHRLLAAMAERYGQERYPQTPNQFVQDLVEARHVNQSLQHALMWHTRYQRLMDDGVLQPTLSSRLCPVDRSLRSPSLEAAVQQAVQLLDKFMHNTRDTYLRNYLEYATATTIGILDVGAFLKQCFD